MKKQQICRISIFLILFGLSITKLYANKPPIKFGKINPKDVQMKVYKADTTAKALILCDFGRTSIYLNKTDSEFQMEYERTVRIKILTKEGLDWGNFNIRLDKDDDQLMKIRGFTYNMENGELEKEKLSNKGKFEEKSNKYYNTYKVTMPNVKEGSIIELNYLIKSKSFFNLREWYFQHSIPVQWSEYRVKIPEYFIYKRISRGYVSFAVNKQTFSSGKLLNNECYSIENLTWAAKDVPAFKSEPYMTSSKNFLSSIDFELACIKLPDYPIRNYTTTWNKINEELLRSQYFGAQLETGAFLTEEVKRINEQFETAEEKIMAAHQFLKKHMKWNGHFGIRTTTSLRKAFKEQNGNVGDINLMLVLMLKKLGIKAHPVILSTRKNGSINTSYPNLNKFNYVIAMVNMGENIHLIDASDPLCPCNLLPFHCLNGKGLVISDSESRWISLSGNSDYKSYSMANLTLDENARVSGTLTTSKDAYAAMEFRKTMDSKSEEDIKIKMEEQFDGITINDIDLENLMKISQPLKIKIEMESNNTEESGDIIYFNPILYEKTQKNPFTLEERNYPVDFGHPYSQSYSLTLTLPKGYTLETQPENIRLSLPGNAGTFTYSINVVEDKLTLISRTKLEKSFFTVEEYPTLKEFFNRIVSKQAEIIMLKRNS